ncbi:MAG: hypothetical protein EAZ44_05985 [Cytophagia bacterium]|nr:MAG: hypothetical protein EAZ44_05985 [Cytophagia bacterium]TAG42866.1 MAG: hypothetical protein EAZ31_05460 [Cytophagia bacterium]
MNKKKYLPLFKIKKTLGRSIVILRMTEVWRLLLIQRHKLRFAKLAPVLLFFIFVILKPVGVYPTKQNTLDILNEGRNKANIKYEK